MGNTDDKFAFWKTSATTWETPHQHRGYTAAIVRADGVGYTITITGSGAPAAAAYPNLRAAKIAFRKFLANVPVS